MSALGFDLLYSGLRDMFSSSLATFRRGLPQARAHGTKTGESSSAVPPESRVQRRLSHHGNSSYLRVLVYEVWLSRSRSA